MTDTSDILIDNHALTITGASTKVTGTQNVYFAVGGATGAGTLTVSDGGYLKTNQRLLAGYQNSGTINVTGTGLIETGVHLVIGDGRVAHAADTKGYLTVKSADSYQSAIGISSSFTVGYLADGVAVIDRGVVTVGNNAYISESTANGTLTINRGGTLRRTGDVGAQTLRIGSTTAGYNSVLNVNGGVLSYKTGTITIGSNGAGSLIVGNGSYVGLNAAVSSNATTGTVSIIGNNVLSATSFASSGTLNLLGDASGFSSMTVTGAASLNMAKTSVAMAQGAGALIRSDWTLLNSTGSTITAAGLTSEGVEAGPFKVYLSEDAKTVSLGLDANKELAATPLATGWSKISGGAQELQTVTLTLNQAADQTFVDWLNVNKASAADVSTQTYNFKLNGDGTVSYNLLTGQQGTSYAVWDFSGNAGGYQVSGIASKASSAYDYIAAPTTGTYSYNDWSTAQSGLSTLSPALVSGGSLE